LLHLLRSPPGRYCYKSPKIPGDDFFERNEAELFLLNPTFAPAVRELADIEDAARTISVELRVYRARADDELEEAFEQIERDRIRAILVASAPYFTNRREKIAALAGHKAIPALYNFREYTAAGGLMSYGTNLTDSYRQVGIYTGRILKGEKPADLPVMQLAKFELVINIKTAKALGLAIPPTLLALADEVIE
jgi:putative tryptophan/tyrosine transport system substrate-binding protein